MIENKKRLVVIFFILVPLFSIAASFMEKFSNELTWPSTQGIIRASVVRDYFKKEKYYPWIIYDFEYKGTTYSGNVLRFKTGTFEETESLVKQYPVGKKLRIFFNPEYIYENYPEIEKNMGLDFYYLSNRIIGHVLSVVRSFFGYVVIQIIIIGSLLWIVSKFSKFSYSLLLLAIIAISITSILLLTPRFGDSYNYANMPMLAVLSSFILFLMLNKIGKIAFKQSVVISVLYFFVDIGLSVLATYLFYALFAIAWLG